MNRILLSLFGLTAIIFASSYFAGCVSGSSETGAPPKRSFKNRVFTDLELGYSLTFPEGWSMEISTAPNSLIDFTAYRFDSGFIAIQHPLVTARHGDTTNVPLVEYAQLIHDDISYEDSSRILPARTVQGVEVVPVLIWPALTIEDVPALRRERVLELLFRRNRQQVIISFTDAYEHFDTNADFRFIDSSLNFIQIPPEWEKP